MLEVRNDTGQTLWCGPTAVAGITGRPISEIDKAFRLERYGRGVTRRKRQPKITRTGWGLISKVLLRYGLGIHVHENFIICRRRCPTLQQWHNGLPSRDSERLFLVGLTAHWVLVKGGLFLDSHTEGKVVRFEEAPNRRCRVEIVWEVLRARAA